MNQELKNLATTWGRQVLMNYLKSRTATAAAGGSVLVVLLPKLMEFLNVTPGQAPTQTQVIVGALVGLYIVARGFADRGKEAALLDVRKNLMLAFSGGDLSQAKTEAFHKFIETGDLAGLLQTIKAEEDQAKAAAESGTPAA